MTTALDILVWGCLLVWLAFAVTYHALAAWHVTEQGRNIMGVSAAVAGFLALAVVARMWPDYDRSWAQALVYAWLLMLGVQRLRQLLRIQLNVRRTRRNLSRPSGDTTH